jgi:hypothetical protein
LSSLPLPATTISNVTKQLDKITLTARPRLRLPSAISAHGRLPAGFV